MGCMCVGGGLGEGSMSHPQRPHLAVWLERRGVDWLVEAWVVHKQRTHGPTKGRESPQQASSTKRTHTAPPNLAHQLLQPPDLFEVKCLGHVDVIERQGPKRHVERGGEVRPCVRGEEALGAVLWVGGKEWGGRKGGWMSVSCCCFIDMKRDFEGHIVSIGGYFIHSVCVFLNIQR